MKELTIKRFNNSNLDTYKQYEKLIIKSFNPILKSCNGMFYNCEKLEEVVIEDWNNVINTSGMFYNCHNLTKVTLPTDWNKVTDASGMFSYCHKLTKVSLPTDWNKVTDTSFMFDFCSNLEEISLPNNWNNITNIYGMFCECSNLTIYYNGTTNLYKECSLPETAKVINLTELTLLDCF